MKKCSIMLLLILILSCSKKSEEQAINKENNLIVKKYEGTLENILKEKVLRVISISNSNASLPRNGGSLSFEYDIAKLFADKLNLNLQVQYVDNYSEILKAIKNREADIAIASLTITDKRKEDYGFTKPLSFVNEVIVTRKELIDSSLENRSITVRKTSSYNTTIHEIKDSLKVEASYVPENLHTFEILENIADSMYDYTICDNDFAEEVMAYRKNLVKRNIIKKHIPRAWAVSKKAHKLLDTLNTFVENEKLTIGRTIFTTDDFDVIKKRKTLRVITRNNPATYWIYRGKEMGFDYELLYAFAEKHHLRLEMLIADSRDQLIKSITDGRADIAAATLTNTQERRRLVSFSKPYLTPFEYLVTRQEVLEAKGNLDFNDSTTITKFKIAVRKGSSYYETLMELEKKLGTKLSLIIVPENIETDEILQRVAKGEYESAICDDYMVNIEKRFLPNLVLATKLSEKREIGWVIRKTNPKLQKAVDTFFSSGKYKPKALHYNLIYNRYFKAENTGSKAKERADKEGSLSVYDTIFKEYAKHYDLDWRMVAAQCYQESKFDPSAESWVGASGLMQLMPTTARSLGVTNVFDPNQNVKGGTKYLQKMLKKFDQTIDYKDRYYFALASYNAGYGHLIDARRLTVKLGKNPNLWFNNVEHAMLKLSQPQYYRNARYGYVRGTEPVDYISNITKLYSGYSSIE